MEELRTLLDVKTAAGTLGVAPVTLRRWLRERRIAFVRAGRRVLLAPEDVARFVARHRVPAGDERGAQPAPATASPQQRLTSGPRSAHPAGGKRRGRR